VESETTVSFTSIAVFSHADICRILTLQITTIERTPSHGITAFFMHIFKNIDASNRWGGVEWGGVGGGRAVAVMR
jgi:hypothetical protein